MGFLKRTHYQEKLIKLSLSQEINKLLEFEECEFDGCSFIDCKFEKCKFINCIFNDCILSATTAAYSRFIELTFSNCKVIGFDWAQTQQIRDLYFTDCQINYSNFKLLKLPKIKIINCEAKEVDFSETDLSEGIFTNTDFERSIFFKTNLTKANFKGAKNYCIDVRHNTLHKTRFSSPEVLSLLYSLDILID